MRTIIRACIACIAMAGAMTCAAAINSRSYVQQGLVAQYDGINNVGHDAAHSDNAATWVNLAGDTALDGTVDSNVVWGEDGWAVLTKCNPITVGNALSQITGTGTFTIQFACKPQTGANGGRQCFFSQYNASNSFGLEHNGTAVGGSIRLYCSGQASTSPVPGGESLVSMANSVVAGKWVSASVTSDNGLRDVTFYTNLVACGERHYKTSKNLNKNCPSVIGGEPYVNARDMAFRGTYNALRVYDRVLTEEEIKINAAIDAVRFNGANWNDYPELADYSFDGNGNLQANFIATAAAGGSVKIDGGAASATAAATFAYGSAAQTHTFTAVPGSGYAFCGWIGDTDAIAEGSFVSAEITVSSARAVSLTAVFKAAPRGLTSLSYVTKGLVALYDGIDNAGYGTHNPNATTWADLTGNGNDGTCASELSWNASSWSVSGNCKPVTLGYGISAVTASGEYTVQFACTPERHNVRECFFSQYASGLNSIGIEHNASGVTAGYLRFYSNAEGSGFLAQTNPFLANEWAQGSITVSNGTKNIGFWKDGTLLQNSAFSGGKKTYKDECASVIGGEPNTGRDMAFRGTYNAFRLYDRALTADEINVNAAVDAIRFNGASASSYTLSGGYSFASDGTLMVDVSATASAGGKVALADSGAFASSVNQSVNQCGAELARLVAKADDGYEFVEWTGDTDAIAAGKACSPAIGVAATCPVSLMAVFRKPSGALDGMVLDLEMSSELEGPIQSAGSWRIGNAMKLSDRPYTNSASSCYHTLYSKNLENYPDYTANFRLYDIAVPALPGVTLASQKCIYYPQYSISSSSLFGVRAETRQVCVEGPVATFYVRFLWEGSTRSSMQNWSTILMNGIDGVSKLNVHGQGLALRLQAPANTTRAYPSVYVCSSTGTYESSDVDLGSDLYIDANRWVDCVVSVYPSPTDDSLSNADIWFCQVPASSSAKPILKHRHIGDNMAFPRMTTSASVNSSIMLGSLASGAGLNDGNASKSFRGAIAAVKGWKRILSESEIGALMAGSYGGTFSAGVENGSADEFGAAGLTEETFNPATMAWRQMKKSLTASDRTLTIEMPLTAENSGLPRMLEIAPLFDGTGASCPVTVTANGSTVGTFDLAKADERAVLLRGKHARRNAEGKLVLTVARPEGCTGTLSFDAISLCGSWQAGDADGAPLALSGPGDSISLCFNVPDTSAEIVGYRYRTRIASVAGNAARPVRLTLNGDTVWSASDVSANQTVDVDIAVGNVKPGVNELAWRLDATDAGSRVTFDLHELKMLPPPLGSAIILR